MPKRYAQSKDELYGENAVLIAGAGQFGYAKQFAEKIGNKKLADEVYGKMAMKAAKIGEFNYAGKFAERIGNKKLADEVYRKMAMKDTARREGYAGKFVEKIKDKELVDKLYGEAAVDAVEKRNFWYAGMLAKKGEKYLKQNHPEVLANIYKRTGKFIKAKDIRKRLEAKKKKK